MISRESGYRGKCCVGRVDVAPRLGGKRRRCRVPGMIPGGNKLPTGDFLKPLCPLRDGTFDDTRYFPLDGSQEKYEAFTSGFMDPGEWTSRGHLIIVAGERFSGKTSLTQRCAAWLRDNAESVGHCEVVAVDLSDEGLAAAMTVDERVEETADRILEAVAKKMPEEQFNEVKAEPSIAGKVRKLSTFLSSRIDAGGKSLLPVVVVVLLRRYSTPAEMDKYYGSIMRKGMIFFAEAYENIDEIRALQPGFDRMEVNAHMIELEVLKAGDFDGLVQRLRQEEPGLPTVPSAMVDTIEKVFIPKRVSAGQLARLALGVLHIATEQAAPVLLQDHLVQYLSGYYLKEPK
jgi:hypothetical protein